jgi:hypothetical protein
MNGNLQCPFKLHVRFLDAMSVVRWSAVENFPRYVRLQASHARYLPGMCRRRLPQTAPFATLGHDAFSRFGQSLGASRDRSAYSIQGLKPDRRSSGLLLPRQYVKKEGDDQPDLRRVSKRLGSLEPSTLFEVQDCGMSLPCDRILPVPLHISTPLAPQIEAT